MLLRIFLILAILAGLGTILVSQLQLRPQIQGIIEERETNHKNWKTQETRANKLNKDLKDTEGRLAKTTKDLEDTQSELTGTKSKLASEQNRANDLQGKLTKATAEAKDAQQKLAAFDVLGVTPDQVRSLKDSEKKIREVNQVLEEEKKLLARKLGQAEEKIALYEGGADVVKVLPRSIRGKVIVVDPKWDFVVLDVGKNQGVEATGMLLVSRDSKLVAKVKVTSVQDDRCVANVVPGWKLGEVFEGDAVMPP
jgi:hypothetical protein